MWNLLTKTTNHYTLEPLPKNLPLALTVAASTDGLIGLSFIANSIMNFTDLLPTGIIGMAVGFVMIVSAQVLGLAVHLLQSFNVSIVFDLRYRKVVMNYPKDSYPYIPREVDFQNIKLFRLRESRKEGESPTQPRRYQWLLELVLSDGRYMPLTCFKDGDKAKSICRDISTVVCVAYDELIDNNFNFKNYKETFLKQFEKQN